MQWFGIPRELLVFLQLRRCLLRNSLNALIRGSPIRVVSIVLVGVLIWAGLYAASAWAFAFLRLNQIPFGGNIIGTLFDIMFLSLGGLLIFSSGIILYSSLFAAPETAFLLSTPAAADQVFAYKFQGALAFSSWAFLLLGLPILVAYGIASEAAWFFYALLIPFFLAFVLLFGSAGALICVLVVCFIPRRGKQLLAVAGAVLVVGGGIWAYRANQVFHPEFLTPHTLQRLYGQLSIVRGPLTPSHWMTCGLQAARSDAAEAGYYLTLLASNSLFLYLLTAWLAGRLYRRGYDRMAAGGQLWRRLGGAWVDRLLSASVGFLHPQTRLLIVKDFRTFRRDPAQWAQVAIFSALLVLYFLNTRRFWQEDLSRPYQNGISLLNVVSIALLMCAYTGRFIYPLLSLEGRKFWVLGLLPMQRDRLLWGKFAFSVAGTLAVAELLILVSDLALGMPRLVIVLHALAVALLAAGLSGLSVGLGACMPNFRETDPSKIAIGFGGTMNLVASLLFLGVVIGLVVVPWHVDAALALAGEFANVQIDPDIGRVTSAYDLSSIGLDAWITAGALAGTALGLLTVAMPLWFGSRTLRRMEF